MMSKIIIPLLLLILTTPVLAQKTAIDFSAGGSIITGADTRACSGALEGAIRYNAGDVEFCDGTDWTDPANAAAGGTLPPNCTNDSTVECSLEGDRVNDDADFIFSNIANGVDILGVIGTCGGGPGFIGMTGSGDYVDCADDTTLVCLLDAVRSNSDPDFIASNIKSGVNILGVVGTNGC